MRPMLEMTTAGLARRPCFDGRTVTLREFDRLPDDGYRYELHDGILHVSPAPATNHDRVVSFLHAKLFAHVERRALGEVFTSDYDVQLTNKRIYRPDIKFVSRENRRIIRVKRLVGAPDLVVEVVSPDDPDRDWRVKFDAYEKAGVREYWIIEAATLSATFYVHDGKRFVNQPVKGTRFASTVVKGFRLDLEALTAYVRRPIGDEDD